MQEKPQNDAENTAPPTQADSSQTAAAAASNSPGPRRPRRSVLARYGKMGFIGQFRHSEREIPPHMTHAVIHTNRGIELGEFVAPFCHHRGTCTISDEQIDAYCASSGPEYPFSRHGRVVRFASQQDIKEQQHLEHAAVAKMELCQELIKKHQLAMHLVTAEHLFGGDRIIYYFMSESRVDFRQLVRELAHEYQTRIEMRQIGARDEARLIADFETCGRECCCKNFLKVLQPVNMRMAKLQKATLDPSKISGRCGRLKCCLRYEDKVYTELRKNLPRNNSRVLTEYGPGVVTDGQIITQLVRVAIDSGRVFVIPVDEILERNYQPPQSPPVGDALPEAGKGKESTPPAVQGSVEGEDRPRKKRRRRRRKKKNNGDGSQSANQNSNNPPSSDG